MLRKVIRRARRLVRRVIGNQPPAFSPVERKAAIVVWHLGRVGSTVISNLFRQRGDTAVGDEVLDGGSLEEVVNGTTRGPLKPWHSWDRSPRFPWGALGELQQATRKHPRRPYMIFEIKPQHLRKNAVEPDLAMRYLHRCLGVDVAIALGRRNQLRRRVSTLRGQQTGVWHLRKTRTAIEFPPVTMDTTNLAESIASQAALTAGAAEWLRGLGFRTLELWYEDHVLEDPRVAYRAICEHAGMPPIETTVALQRTTTEPLKQVLANYDEVASALRNTDLEWMLDD